MGPQVVPCENDKNLKMSKNDENLRKFFFDKKCLKTTKQDLKLIFDKKYFSTTGSSTLGRSLQLGDRPLRLKPVSPILLDYPFLKLGSETDH